MNKSLEALKRIKPYADSSIDADLEIIEQELKAFDLIKTKEVDPTMIYNNYNNYEGYLAEMEKYYVSHNLQRDREEWDSNYILTREEFDFLNSVLFENEEEED